MGIRSAALVLGALVVASVAVVDPSGLAPFGPAKWWAIYAQNLVGPWSALYLGAWDTAPIPGGLNPWTGQPVPNPLQVGSFYYDSTTGQMMVWNLRMSLPMICTSAGQNFL